MYVYICVYMCVCIYKCFGIQPDTGLLFILVWRCACVHVFMRSSTAVNFLFVCMLTHSFSCMHAWQTGNVVLLNPSTDKVICTGIFFVFGCLFVRLATIIGFLF